MQFMKRISTNTHFNKKWTIHLSIYGFNPHLSYIDIFYMQVYFIYRYIYMQVVRCITLQTRIGGSTCVLYYEINLKNTKEQAVIGHNYVENN